MGDFDQDMQREKDFAQERANENTGGGSIGGIGEFEDYVEDEPEAQSGAQTNNTTKTVSSSNSGSGAAGQDNSAGGEGGREGNNTVNGSNPEQQANDVLLPEDDEVDADLRKNDDIVARQLRELAENETDPVLKEQYWQDYYNYKSGN